MDKPSFEASLRALARRRAQESHPEPSELAAYHAGELTEDQEEKIQDHLTFCEECARLLLGFSEYSRFQPAKDTDAAADDQSAAAWQRFQARLREEEGPVTAREEVPSAPVVPLQRRRTSLWQRPGVAWAVAAGLAVCVVGLAIQDFPPPQPPVERSEPRFSGNNGNVISLELNGEEGVHRGGAAEPAPAIDPSAPILEYEIRLPGADPEARYEVELLDTEDTPLWTGTSTPSDGYLGIEFGRSYLPAGSYRFRIHKNEGNENRTLVGTTESFSVP